MSLHDADTKGTDPQDMFYSSKDSVALCVLTVNNFTHDKHAHKKMWLLFYGQSLHKKQIIILS